jgi:hypothetical protein
MAKIINYATAVYPQTELIQRMLCSELACAPSCGRASGFKQFSSTDAITSREIRGISKYINYELSNTQNIVEILSKLIGITYTLNEKAIAKYKSGQVYHITL